MAGFYAQEDIRAFVKARREAHEALGCAPNAHLTLNDLRAMEAQPQTTVEAFSEMLASPEFRSRRLAFIVAPNWARTQVLRALADRDAKCFTDPEAAEAWLLAEDSCETSRRATG